MSKSKLFTSKGNKVGNCSLSLKKAMVSSKFGMSKKISWMTSKILIASFSEKTGRFSVMSLTEKIVAQLLVMSSTSWGEKPCVEVLSIEHASFDWLKTYINAAFIMFVIGGNWPLVRMFLHFTTFTNYFKWENFTITFSTTTLTSWAAIAAAAMKWLLWHNQIVQTLVCSYPVATLSTYKLLNLFFTGAKLLPMIKDYNVGLQTIPSSSPRFL